jgi:CBS-domain-containing membrane protein
MKARDVMTERVISIAPDANVLQAARLMLQNHVSGLPVVDDNGALLGIITEGDFLRRSELGTEKRRPRWLEFLIGPGKLAGEYVQASGRKVEEVMSRELVTIGEDTPLDEIVHLMEKHRVKRLPVLRAGRLVGIVSRSNLMHALASLAREAPPAATDDAALRARLLSELAKRSWAPLATIDVVVRNGVVEFFGVITDENERQALLVAAENVPGVKGVRDHLAWLEPTSGTIVAQPDETAARAS